MFIEVSIVSHRAYCMFIELSRLVLFHTGLDKNSMLKDTKIYPSTRL